MSRTPQSRRFWRIFGPVLGYWGIQIIAQIIIAMTIVALNTEKIAEVMMHVTEANMMEKVAELSMTMTQYLMDHQSLASAFLALCTGILAVILFVRDRKKEREAQLPITQKASAAQYAWILLFGTAFCLGMNVIITMSGLAARDAYFLRASEALYTEGIAVMLICQGVIVPIAEELMFRGVLYKRCREQMSFWNAAFAVSVFFALTHSTMTQLMYTVLLAMFLAYFYEKYGSLKAPILLHMVVNIISIVITKTGVFVWLCSDLMRMGVCVVGCAFVGAVAFVKIQKIEIKMEVNVKV